MLSQTMDFDSFRSVCEEMGFHVHYPDYNPPTNYIWVYNSSGHPWVIHSHAVLHKIKDREKLESLLFSWTFEGTVPHPHLNSQ
jgi:nucleoside 2-deoxyribosyltransferase